MNLVVETESELAYSVYEALLYFPQAALLDIGSNLGYYTLMAASQDHRVYSVDPVLSNLAYIRKSGELSGTLGQITLINNAVSDENEVVIPYNQIEANEGMVTMVNEEQYDNLTDQQKLQTLPGILTVTLNQLLNHIDEDTVILKVDVEGFECKVLNNFLQSPDKNHYVPYIVMEWAWVKVNMNGWCPYPGQLIENFELAGYRAYKEGPLKEAIQQPMNKSRLNENSNLVWIHHSARDTLLQSSPTLSL